MPKITDDEIKARIADGRVLGISVDTEVFDQYGCNLDFTILRKLDQFLNSSVQVYLSEIVTSEIADHIARDAAESQRSLNSAIKKLSKRWKTTIDFDRLNKELYLTAEPRSAADRQVNDYIDAVGAQIVPASGYIDVSAEVLRRYFSAEPPFESKNKKKHEFPDAFAVLTIEAVAAQKGHEILCVSNDSGWLAFAEESNHLICVNDLTHALSLFNDAGRTTADNVMTLLRCGKAAALETAVEAAFESRLSDNDYLLDANSYLEIYIEPISAVMQSLDYDDVSPPIVIAADDDEITFIVTLPASVEFESSVDFYAYDGIDKEHLLLTNEVFTTTQKDKYQIVITVAREINEEPDVLNVEIAKHRTKVNFGEVEPFRDENPEHEKY